MPFYGADYPQPEEEKFEDDVGVADARGRYLGPISLYSKKDTDPTWDYVNTIVCNVS